MAQYTLFERTIEPADPDERYQWVSDNEAVLFGPPPDPIDWIRFWLEWNEQGTRCPNAYRLALCGARWNLHAPTPNTPMLYIPYSTIHKLLDEVIPLLPNSARLSLFDIVETLHYTRTDEARNPTIDRLIDAMGELRLLAAFWKYDWRRHQALKAQMQALQERVQQHAHELPQTLAQEILQQDP